MEKPTPRINSALLPEYINHSVRVVGKVIQIQGSKAILESSDHGQILVTLLPVNNIGTKYTEIIGLVQEDRTVQEFSSCNLGDNFDLDSYNKLVELTHKYKELFQ